MTDFLVRLYDLTDPGPHLAALAQRGIAVQRAMAAEKKPVVDWVRRHFGDGWAAECEVAFSRDPIACTIAVTGGRLAGFACYDSTCRNFFGPVGVDPSLRHQGIGRGVLLATLHAMGHAGYAYAIIGGAGPSGFFEKCVGAFPIPGSTPGIYRPPIKTI